MKQCYAIRSDIEEVADGTADPENNVLKNAPHTEYAVLSDEWDRPYSRTNAAYPAEFVRITNSGHQWHELTTPMAIEIWYVVVFRLMPMKNSKLFDYSLNPDYFSGSEFYGVIIVSSL